jgi:hypothetical protein
LLARLSSSGGIATSPSGGPLFNFDVFFDIKFFIYVGVEENFSA